MAMPFANGIAMTDITSGFILRKHKKHPRVKTQGEDIGRADGTCKWHCHDRYHNLGIYPEEKPWTIS
jgi:hypothetical protein